MFVRLMVITLCAAFVAGELQCPGPGRFSVTPGMCTSEYYTCNRDMNKEYIVYVLSCPGATLFNERTRKCSSARSVSCVYPPNTTPSGQIKVTTSGREKMTTRQSSSWISRPGHRYRLTTVKQLVDYRTPTPGTLPWVTPRPYSQSTLAMTSEVKPQKNQWRIRKSTTKKITLAKSTKPSPAKVVMRKTTHSLVQHKKRTTSKIGPYSLHHKINTQSQNLNESPVYQQITEVNYSATTSAMPSSAPLTTLLDKNANINTSFVPDPKPVSAITTSTDTVSSRNIYTIIPPPATSPTSTTVKMEQVSDPPLCKCDEHRTQITPGYVTHPLTETTSQRTFNGDNAYDTTPELFLKESNKIKVPFMDSLESDEQNSGIEIVQVDFNSSTKKGLNQKRLEVTDQNITPIKHIRYFYDPDTSSALNHSLVDKSLNSSKVSIKKTEQKILQKKHRQPK